MVGRRCCWFIYLSGDDDLCILHDVALWTWLYMFVVGWSRGRGGCMVEVEVMVDLRR